MRRPREIVYQVYVMYIEPRQWLTIVQFDHVALRERCNLAVDGIVIMIL